MSEAVDLSRPYPTWQEEKLVAEALRLRNLLEQIANSVEYPLCCTVGTHRDCVIVHIQDGLWDNELEEFRELDDE